MDLVQIENLDFSYRTSVDEPVPILKNVNFTIRRGEALAIQGPSGSGKSTLLYIVGCLLTSYKGKVTVLGQDIAKLSEQERAILRNKTIGFVFQQFYLLPKATVLENILLPNAYPSEMPARPIAIERAKALAIQMGLGERLNYYPSQLSGGQQQRVSIARALLNETEIILADEPTGSLDTKNSEQILDILIEATRQGRTVIIITHDPEVARRCDRVIHFRDGTIREVIENKPLVTDSKSELDSTSQASLPSSFWTRAWHLVRRLTPLALQSLRQNKTRSALTMLGIVIGVAAVLSMLTVGSFTKKRILDSYAEMGVNTLLFYAYSNWDLRATDKVPTVFYSLDMEKDILPLGKIFPEITKMSPMLQMWGSTTVSYGGLKIDSDVRVLGISEDGLELANRKLLIGNNFSPFQMEYRSPVCIIGFEVYQRLFSNIDPLGKIIFITQDQTAIGCRVSGVLENHETNKEFQKPNLQIYFPYTFFQANVEPWYARIRNILIRVQPDADTQVTGKKIKAFYEMKYGKSGRFDANSDTALIAQMNKFLSLFTVLLGAIALVSLAVGGIGITNMMLVSVTERFKEIGIRKAFGATNFSIRVQYLMESMLLCCFAGFIGLVIGFILYQSAIYGATQLIPSVHYEWVIDWLALSVSLGAIFAVGLLSGLTPAWKAERLQVIEALRSD